MATPSRFPNGISNAAPWQMFAGMGVENPFFYHQFYDDFDVPLLSSGWTVTASTGTAANASGDGGVTVLTTTGAIGNFASIQRPTATFMPVAGKKLYFVARLLMSDIVGGSVIAGLYPAGSVTPFVSPANGIWISKTAGTSQIVLNVANAGVVTSTNFPLTALTLANAVSFDVGFEVTSGASFGTGPTIRGSLSPNLVGYVPQSGNGSANSTNRAPTIVSTAPIITTLQATALAPLLGILSGTGAVEVLTSDFIGAFRER